MTKKPTQTKNKRQPTKSQLPSSSAKKKIIAAATAKSQPKAKTTEKPVKVSAKPTESAKKVAKKPATKPVKAATKPAAPKKKPVAKPRKTVTKTATTKKPAKKTALVKKASIKKPTTTKTKTTTRRSPKRKNMSIYLPFARQTITFSIQVAKAKSKPKKKTPATRKNTKQRTSPLKKLFSPILRNYHIDFSLFFLVAGLFGTVYFGLQVVALAAPAPPADFSYTPQLVAPEEKPKTLPASTAVRLQMPDIGIDTDVMTVGKNPDNTIEVPSNYHIAGQYKFAPTPGELGPAIIVGHVDNYKGPGVFWRLREAQPGQIIKVVRQDGSVAQFRVDGVTAVSQDNFPTQQIYGDINYAGLRLITCGGSFNVLTQRYSENTVVFASLIEDFIPDETTKVQDLEVKSNVLVDSLR